MKTPAAVVAGLALSVSACGYTSGSAAANDIRQRQAGSDRIDDRAGQARPSRRCRRPGVIRGRGFHNREWVIEKLRAPIPEAPFEASVNGVSIGKARLLAFASRAGGTSRYPQVLALYSSGYLRITPGNPRPPIPFGQSLVLGPAVFGTSASFPNPVLFSNPQVQRVEVDACRLRRSGAGTLKIRVQAEDRDLPATSTKTNQVMDLEWSIALREPTKRRTRIDVSGAFAFTEGVRPDPQRTAESQSLRLVQISSMFIDADRHDVDRFRFRDASGPVDVGYEPGQANSLLPRTPTALAGRYPIIDSLHTDNVGLPNGNTPSYRIRIARTTGPMSGPLTARAFFNDSQDLNHDNLGLWVHQRPLDALPRGARGTIRFRAEATADPQRPF